jgi:hypothetical protein
MGAVAVTSSRTADAGPVLAHHAPSAPAGHPAERMRNPEASGSGLAPAVGLLVAATASLGLWGLLAVAARFVLA